MEKTDILQEQSRAAPTPTRTCSPYEPAGRRTDQLQLIDALAMEWEPEAFHDSFHEKVEALVQAKAAGETVEKAELAAEPTGAVDLMEALRASVERARSPKDTGDKAASPGARAARGQKTPAPKKRARSGPAAKGRKLHRTPTSGTAPSTARPSAAPQARTTSSSSLSGPASTLATSTWTTAC